MRPIDADVLKEALLKERDKIPLVMSERYSFGYPTPCKHGESMRGGIRKALRCMENTPTLDLTPVVHGEWVDKTKIVYGSPDWKYTCSKCGHAVWCPADLTNFCPSCGAKMDGGKRDDT